MQEKAAAHADETPRPAPANETPAEATRERAPQGESSAGILTHSKSVPCIVWLAICCALVAVMLASGFNFFPLVALALAMITALVLLVLTLCNRPINLFLWCAFSVIYAGLFLYFLIWGADAFGKRLWWNLVLVACPALLATALLLLGRAFGGRTLKILSVLTLALMMATSGVYALFMNLRARPVVDRLWEGHDEYLSSVSAAKRVASPNVLVILMDDMGYADISAFSYLTGGTPTISTPNIDSIAANGVMMENFYAASPVCSPSRFSLLTGRYSSRGYLDNVVFPTTVESTPWSPTHFVNPYQFLFNVDGLLGDEITVAEVLQAAGYDTACIGKWNLGDYGEYLPTEQGFDYFYGSYYVNDMTPYNWVRDTGAGHPDGATHAEVRSHADNLDQSETTRLLTDELKSFVSSSAESGTPFFVYYATPWPHYPIFSDNNGGGKGDTSDDSYIDCIEEFDRYLGVVLDYLKSTPDTVNGGTLYNNTLVVFTSDNGPGREGATGALRGRKGTTFEGGMKVPLIASYPAGRVGVTPDSTLDIAYSDGTAVSLPTTRIENSSMMFDLFATVLSVCGIRDGNGVFLPDDRIIDGKDLTPLWTGASTEDVHDELIYLKGGRALAVQVTGVELPDGTVSDFKYYDDVQSENTAFFNQRYRNYLFDLNADPIEAYNVSMVYPDIAKTLSERLDAFREDMKSNRRGIL